MGQNETGWDFFEGPPVPFRKVRQRNASEIANSVAIRHKLLTLWFLCRQMQPTPAALQPRNQADKSPRHAPKIDRSVPFVIGPWSLVLGPLPFVRFADGQRLAQSNRFLGRTKTTIVSERPAQGMTWVQAGSAVRIQWFERNRSGVGIHP
jgi:hypothetical protein